MSPRRPDRHRHVRVLVLAVVLALVAVACTGTTGDDTSTTAEPASEQPDAVGLSIAVASFDLAVGEDRRLLAGVLTDEAELLSFGEVRFELGYLGDEAGGATEITQRVTGSFLPVPGWEPQGSSDRPTLEATDGRGVYAATVDLDRPGNWGLRVVAELDDGRVLEGQTVFDVAAETQVPDVGDPAPRVANHTIEDVEQGRVEPAALDSRAQGEDAVVPDRILHDTRIPDALDDGRPTVVIASTPVYCRTNFCGPLVETLAQAAEEYGDRAAFVHLEIYADFEAQQLNEAAAAWVQPADGSNGGEPWVFLVGSDGRIAARWDNVLDLAELRTLLDELPELPTAGPTEDA